MEGVSIARLRFLWFSFFDSGTWATQLYEEFFCLLLSQITKHHQFFKVRCFPLQGLSVSQTFLHQVPQNLISVNINTDSIVIIFPLKPFLILPKQPGHIEYQWGVGDEAPKAIGHANDLHVNVLLYEVCWRILLRSRQIKGYQEVEAKELEDRIYQVNYPPGNHQSLILS